jgi:hypothetical protein
MKESKRTPASSPHQRDLKSERTFAMKGIISVGGCIRDFHEIPQMDWGWLNWLRRNIQSCRIL